MKKEFNIVIEQDEDGFLSLPFLNFMAVIRKQNRWMF